MTSWPERPAEPRRAVRLVPRPARGDVFADLPDDGLLAPEVVAAALDQGLVEVHYQPVVGLPSRHVVGFEALARLRLPDGRLVPPARFIPVAERTGLVIPLGLDVLRRAVARAVAWRAGSTSVATATVSVNVASPQLEQPDFLDVVRELLAGSGLPPAALVLEITESVATSDAVRPILEELAAIGVRVALDDFGVGFATLDNLRRLPVQILKLDRSFVAGVVRPGADRAIVRVVVDLADSLGLSVIAEGVETAEQADVLVRLGCGNVQGYLFARPGPDPEAVAAGVESALGPPRPTAEAEDGWNPAHDAALLAAARLLGGEDDRARAAVHAVATRAAGLLGMPEGAVRSVGRLALVHDLHRLAVDGALPAALAEVPRLRTLVAACRDKAGLHGHDHPPHGPVVADRELFVLRHAVMAVSAATALDPGLGPNALAAGLLATAARHVTGALPADGRGHGRQPAHQHQHEHDHGHGPCQGHDHGPEDDLSAVLVALSLDVPDVVPLGELFDDLDRRRNGRRGMEERLRSLVGITKVLGSTRDPREALRAALEEVRRIVGAASATLERWERDRAELRALVNVGALGPGESTFPEDETYALGDYEQIKHTMLGRLPYIHTVDDPEADPAAVALLRSLHKYSSAAVPIYIEGRVWGQLWFATELGEPAFAISDIELLTAVATLMGTVVVQVENLERDARLAFEDPLTGLGNRRAVDDALRELAAAERQVTLALIDVDLLKQINDTEGHARGDQALIKVADALAAQASALPGAVVGRLGGDEFCVVVPDAAPAAVEELVEQVTRTLAATQGPTVSVGLATVVEPWEPRWLLTTADHQLYEAKRRRGR